MSLPPPASPVLHVSPRSIDRPSPPRPGAGLRRGLGLLALVVPAACSLAPSPGTPAPVERLPAEYSSLEEAPAPTEPWAPVRWWSSYGDPDLDRLVDVVLEANLDLAEAIARVEEVRALAGIATADLLPALGGSADVTNSSNPTNTGFGRQIGELLGGGAGDSTAAPGDTLQPRGPDRFSNTTWSAALNLSYEVDFWGRARNDRAAAIRDLRASESDLQSALLGVLAGTITTWYEVADLQTRVALTEEIVGVLEERVEQTATRYDRGLVGSFELYQVRQDLQNTAAGLPQLRTALQDARGRLAVLAGRYPGELAPILGTPSLPTADLPDIPPAVPSDLLWQRPDVRSAGLRMEAARLRVGARRAELLPRLSLTGTLGLQSNDAEGLADLSQWFRNLTAGLTAPLFQGGRLRANVGAQDARWDQQRAVYGRTVLTAVAEVETALARVRMEGDRFAFLRGQLEEAEASVDLQSRRYASGVAGYADYLDALRNRLTVQTILATAARDYALARLGVHRALGGTWIQDLAGVDLPAIDAVALPSDPTGSNR
jgi:outer membrane protein, multidrug efflux system